MGADLSSPSDIEQPPFPGLFQAENKNIQAFRL
jgi:hypothetical protein